MVKASMDIDAMCARPLAAKVDPNKMKRKKTEFTIEPSPLMQISAEVIEPNKQNLEKAGLWDFICARWPMADPDRVLAYLVGSSRGSQEEFRIQGQIVHFDVNTISQHFPGLPTIGATLVGIKLLSKSEVSQIFDRPSDAEVDGGYTINKAKIHWREWLKYVNVRLLMALEGTEIVTPDGLAAAYRSWNGEVLNWVKILYNQIRTEIARKTTRNRLFFHNTTYLSQFCPPLFEESQQEQTKDQTESSRKKKSRKLSSYQEEYELDDAPIALAPSMVQSPEDSWIPVIVTPEPESIIIAEPRTKLALPPSPDQPLIRKKKITSSTTQGSNDDTLKSNKSPALANQHMTVELITHLGQREESIKSRSDITRKSTPSKTGSTKRNMCKHDQEETLNECERLELLVSEKDDLVIQYQTSIKEVLKAKDELERKLQTEKEKLLLELKKAEADIEIWKKKYDEQDSNIQRHEEKVSQLSSDVKEAMQKLNEQNSLYIFEKENGVKLAKEVAMLIQQHAKELHDAKFNNPITNLITQLDASTMVSLENNVRTLAEANAKLQSQLTEEQSHRLKLQEFIWTRELNAPPSFSLFREYELQKDAFFSITNLPRGIILTDEEFDKIWASVSQCPNMHNLICEMIARADLTLSTPTKLMVPIGDLGARVLLYYLTLEEQLERKRSLDQPLEVYRYIQLPEMPLKTPGDLMEWQSILEDLALNMQDDSGFINTLVHVHAREAVAQRGELTVAQYIYGRVRTCQRLYRSFEGLKKTVIDPEEYRLQVLLSLPPFEFKAPSWIKMPTPVVGSFLKQRYLGNYNQLFDEDKEKPFPTWLAIEWILEDFGLSRKNWRQWDKLYPRLSQTWSTTLPVVVATDPHFCPLKGIRRYKWAPWARIDSIPYNWPQIPGTFGTYQECAISYRTFFELHRCHTDPICFRAAIFCNFLAYMCSQYKLVVNVNRYDETKVEFQLWLKLQQKPTRYIRLLECMAITNFLNGPSSVFALEFSTKRQQQISCWLNYQKTHQTYLMTYDDDVRRNLEDLEMQSLTQELELEEEFKHKKPKLEVRRRN